MRPVRFAILAFAASAIVASAQTRPAPPAQPGPAGTQPVARAPVRPPRGVQVMTLSSAAWTDGGQIPAKHTQAGGEMSPPLAWSDVPDDVVSFVLVVHDPDAATGNGTGDTLHWMVWDIPGTARSLPEGVPQGSEMADGARQISATGPNYRGPGAAAAGPAHHYVFELFALDSKVEVPAVGASPVQTRAAVEAAMAGHVRGKGVLVGLFRRR